MSLSTDGALPLQRSTLGELEWVSHAGIVGGLAGSPRPVQGYGGAVRLRLVPPLPLPWLPRPRRHLRGAGERVPEVPVEPGDLSRRLLPGHPLSLRLLESAGLDRLRSHRRTDASQ